MQEDPASDEALWDLARAGDGQAFGVLFDRHQDRVFRHVVRMADTRQDAEDIVAAAFLELWRRRDAVRLVGGSVLPWLLVTSTNVGLNVARGIRRYRSLLARLPRATMAPDPVDVLGGVGALGMDERLQAALDDVGDADRRLLTLVIVDGYSLAEAAELLGVSVSAAKSRLHRMRARLRSRTRPHLAAEPLRQSGEVR